MDERLKDKLAEQMNDVRALRGELHASRDELRALQERKREVVQREMSLARELTQVKNKAMLI